VMWFKVVAALAEQSWVLAQPVKRSRAPSVARARPAADASGPAAYRSVDEAVV